MGWWDSKSGRTTRREVGSRASNHLSWGSDDPVSHAKAMVRAAREQRIREEEAKRKRAEQEAAARKLNENRKKVEAENRRKREERERLRQRNLSAGKSRTARGSGGWWR